MATPLSPAAAKIAAAILAQVDKVIRESGHGQVIVNVRDGKVQMIDVRNTYLIKNLPE